MKAKIVFTSTSSNECMSDEITTSFKGDMKVWANAIAKAYASMGVEVLAVNKIEEAEVGLI